MRRSKKLLSFVASLLLLASLLLPLIHPGTAHADPAGQSKWNPIPISTCQGLQDINNDLEATYTLSNDLDCSGSGFTTIGKVDGGTYTFTGRLYGGGHTISNLDTPLFNEINNSIIANLYLTGSLTVDSANPGAFLAVSAGQGLVSDVHVTGNLTITDSSAGGGGLFVIATTVSILRSSAVLSVQVPGTQAQYGGLVTYIANSLVQDSYAITNMNSITGSVEHAGGFSVYMTSSKVINSYTGGSISNPTLVHEIGGFAYSIDGVNPQIVNSFSSLQGVGQCNGVNGCGAFSVTVYASGLDLSTDYFDKTALGTTRCTGDNANTTCHAVNTDGSQGNYFKNNSTNVPLNQWDFSGVWAVNVGLPTLRSFSDPAPQPDPVVGLTANIGSATSIDLSWTQPANTGSAPRLAQTVYYLKDGETTWQNAPGSEVNSYITPSQNLTGNSLTISNLHPSTSYTIELVFFNQDGYFSTATVTGVTGTPGFAIINTCQQLQDITNTLSDNYELGRNIDCSDTVNWNGGSGFVPIGCQAGGGSAFIGALEGNNYTISNLYIDGGACYGGALFYGTNDALIQDINVTDPIVHTVSSSAFSNAVVTVNDQGSSFINLHISVNAPDLDQTLAGGIVGENSGSTPTTISRSSFTGNVNGDLLYTNQFGGFVGSQTGPLVITNSYAQFTIATTGIGIFGGLVGGLVGGNSNAALQITNSYASLINDASNAIFDDHDSFQVTGGLVGYVQGQDTNPSITHSFARTQVLTASSPPQIVLTGGILGYFYDGQVTPFDMSGNYFDADLVGTSQCSGTTQDFSYRPVVCDVITGQPNYFYNNSTNPPLNSWDFDNIWQTTSTLPIFGTKSRNAITPIPASRLTPKQGPASKVTVRTASSVKESPVALIAQRKAQAQTGGSTSSQPQGLIGQLKELLSHVPAVVLVNFPYVLVGLLLLAALALLIEMLRQNQRLKQLNLLLAEQRSVAEKRDTFWHLAANYLRAPITLLMGGVDLMALSKQETPETKKLSILSQRLQTKVADIMKQIEGSHTLQGIKAPKTEKPRVIWRSVGFWLPLLTVAVLVVATNYVAHAWRNLEISTISLASQALLFVLVGFLLYWALGALGLANRRRRNAEQLLKQQERALDEARLHLMQRTATDLDADVTHVQALLGKLPARTHQAQAIAQEGATRLRHLVDSFHLLVTAQNHRLSGLSSVSAHTSLDRAIKEAVAELEPEIAAKGLTVDLPAKHGLRIPGSPDLTSQVLSSVLSNAVAFSPSGSTIRLDIEQTDDSIRLQIADHGPGIKPGQQAHLFEPFTKADGLTGLQLDHDGLGINLYLDRQIMDYLGGQITVHNATGQGAVVELQWPNKGIAVAHPGMVVHRGAAT